ncbi:Putative ribonuclease H protein At1g65750 [Linum grandiflorum]
MGFCQHTTWKEVLYLELIAVRNGLSLIQVMGFTKVWLESDSLEGIKLIKDGDVDSHPLAAILYDIRSLINGRWECKVSHVLREANQLADSMAKMGHDSSLEEEKLFATPPEEMLGIWQNDKDGMTFPRR